MALTGDFVNSILSLAKVAILSRIPSKKGKRNGSIVIMGNGPSLRDTIDNHRDWLDANTLMAVNFAANTPEFVSLCPEYYILADGHFFNGIDSDANVRKLWDNLRNSPHDMTLFVPVKRRKAAERLLDGSKVRVRTFNLTPVEGLRPISHLLFNAGLGMPRPRNVMIPAIMTAIREGFDTILLAGADHSWSRTLDVDEENRVVSIQPHFYSDGKEELRRVATEYAGYHLHDILNSLTIAFRSYFQIRDWAESRGVRIENATKGSMIDAFPRVRF